MSMPQNALQRRGTDEPHTLLKLNYPAWRRLEITQMAQTWLVTDALVSSKMILMLLTARTQANVHSQAKHSLAKVCGAAASRLSLLGAML